MIFTFLQSLTHPLLFSIQYKYLYLWLNLTYSSFCKDDLKHKFTEIEKSGQMHISIEVKTGNFFLGNGTN